jgi:peptidyl-prolyl cis-trans isomerase-like protein 2
MSKHRHSKDKLHLTYSEIRDEFASKKKKKVPFEKLPFYCCALSLAPFEDPVCTSDGHVFDLLYIMPFIRKYQRNPVTGTPLKASELIKMHWTRSENLHNPLEFQDPISYKIFT